MTFSSPPLKTGFFFLAILILFHLNLRSSNSEDIQALKYLPFSLLNEGNFDFNEFPQLYPSYRLVEIHGHYFSTFPILTALLATPIYAPFIWLGVEANETSTAILSKISASFFVLASCVLVFLVLKKEGNPYFAVLCYALGSGLWSILAQDLESQTAGILCHAMILFLLFSTWPKRSFWIGICIGIALGIRQSNLVPSVVLALIVLRCWGAKAFFQLAFGASFSFAPSLALNFWIYGDILGGYAANHQLWGFRMNPETGVYFSHPMGWGLLGLLWSPSRGLLIYSPWLLFFCIGYRQRWKAGGIPRFLVFPVLVHLLFYSAFWNWPGGVHYGGRFLLDLFPYWIYLMFPAFNAPQQTLLKITGFLAIAIHALGAFAYENLGPNSWDITPIHTMHRPSRFWEISDCQIVRTLKQLPQAPELLGFPTVAERSQRVQKQETESVRLDCLEIRKSLDLGDLQRVEHLLVHARQWGESDELYELEGYCRWKQNRFQEAFQAFEKGYRFSQSLSCLIQAIQLCRQLREYDTGIRLLTEASQKLSLFYQPFYLLGMVWRESGAPQKAIPALQRALSLKSGQIEIHLELGTAFMEAEDFSGFAEFWKTLSFPWTDANKTTLFRAVHDSNPIKKICALLLLEKKEPLSSELEKIKEATLLHLNFKLVSALHKLLEYQ